MSFLLHCHVAIFWVALSLLLYILEATLFPALCSKHHLGFGYGYVCMAYRVHVDKLAQCANCVSTKYLKHTFVRIYMLLRVYVRTLLGVDVHTVTDIVCIHVQESMTIYCDLQNQWGFSTVFNG